jgi:hypothetical protein
MPQDIHTYAGQQGYIYPEHAEGPVLSEVEGALVGDATLFSNDMRRLDRLFYFEFCVLMSGRDFLKSGGIIIKLVKNLSK